MSPDVSNSTRPSDKLRAKIEARNQRKETTGLQRIPFVLDEGIADVAEKLANRDIELETEAVELQAETAEREPEDGDDVRASGHDLTEAGRRIAEITAEREQLAPELARAVAEAVDNIVWMVFRQATDDEYQALLLKAGGIAVETDAKAAVLFHNSLVERCFLRVEDGGVDTGYTWEQFRNENRLAFGEMDPIRGMVFANNRRAGNHRPFVSRR